MAEKGLCKTWGFQTDVIDFLFLNLWDSLVVAVAHAQ